MKKFIIVLTHLLEYTLADTDNMCRWINQYCEHHPVDLVIKTGHRTESLFYTPSDWQLMRLLSCSLLILSDAKWRARRRLLATVDANSPSEKQASINSKVLQQAMSLANSQDFELHAVYVHPIPTTKIELCLVEQDIFERENQQKAEQYLERQLLENNAPESLEAHVTFGAPHKRIPSVANSIKADMVVVGCPGRKGLDAVLIGNTAEKILHHLRTDILVVKP